MLDIMRRNSKSWIMILLFAIIIFVFILNFGPWAGNQLSNVPNAAVVNNEPISMAEFRTAYTSQFTRIKQFRPDYDQTQADKDGLKQLVVEQLITRELLTQLGRKNHLKIGPKTLAEEIKERVFGEEAEFNKEEYVRRVHAYFQSSVAQFEEQVAKEVVAEKMADLLGTAVFVSENEIRSAYNDKNTKIAIEFVKVNPEYFTKTGSSSADEIKRYQGANGKKISDYYNEHLSEYVKDQEIKASHILVKVKPGATAEDKATLKEKAQKIRDRVKTNEDFAVVAKAESEDEGSKTTGGDLGYFSQGMMVEEFSKAAFALKPGEISEVVESPFGFHIIKQVDQKPKTERKLEDVSSEIAELLLRKDEKAKKAREMASLALDQLKNGVPLEKVKVEGVFNVKASGKQPTEPNAPIADETELFSRSSNYVYKIGRADGLSDEAFSLTMEKRLPKDVIEMNGEFFAIRLKSKQEADPSKYEEQKEAMKASLLYPRRRAFMQQYLTHLKTSAKITYNDALQSSQEEINP